MRSSQKALLDAFKPHLKEHGFSKRDATWHLQKPSLIHVFNIQTSDWSERYYFNAGIYFRELGDRAYPAEQYCHIRTRLPDRKLHEPFVERVDYLSDFENEQGDSGDRIIQLKNLVYPLAFNWFERFSDLTSSKRELLRLGRPWFAVSKPVWSLLEIPFPE